MKADSIHTLIKYAQKLGYKVCRNCKDSEILWKPAYPHNKPLSIMLSKHKDSTFEVYDMLHELGHHTIRRNWRQYKENYPLTVEADKMHYQYGEYKYKRRLGYKLEEVREEFSAWDVGLDIARKKGIQLNVADYRKYAAKCLMSYVRHHGKR